MIELSGVTKAFGETEVLRNFSALFKRNEPAAVTGASGSGKTTLLRLVLGLEKADAGNIIFDGEPRFGVCFQEDRLFEGFTAAENISLATGLRDTELIEAELLRLLPEEALLKPVKKLSGGQRRRVSIVRASVAEADVLIFDEPFSGLDAENAAAASEYIREKAEGKTLIMGLHEKDIPRWCENIIVINTKEP